MVENLKKIIYERQKIREETLIALYHEYFNKQGEESRFQPDLSELEECDKEKYLAILYLSEKNLVNVRFPNKIKFHCNAVITSEGIDYVEKLLFNIRW